MHRKRIKTKGYIGLNGFSKKFFGSHIRYATEIVRYFPHKLVSIDWKMIIVGKCGLPKIVFAK